MVKTLKETLLGKSLYLFMAVALTAGFASCSDDDDDEVPAAQTVAGTYSAYSSASFKYSATPIVTNGESVTIAANSDGTVKVTLTSGTWGTATVSNATVAKSGSDYSIAGSGSVAMGMHSGSTSDYDCTLAGTISGDKSTYSFVVTVPSVMGGTTITFINGDASAAQLLQGSYSGTSTMVMKYMPDGVDYTGQTTTITANEDGTVNIAYSFTTTDEESGTTSEMGSITLSNVTLTESGENYTFSVENATFNMGMSGTLSEYTCNVEGTISKDKETFSIVYTIPAVMGGTTVTFHNVAE